MSLHRFLVLGAITALSLAAADYDLLIRNARIADGSGSPAITGDVGIAGGKIVAVGKLASATATRAIDAGGHVLAPGFIDVHTHVDLKIGYGALGAIEKMPLALNPLTPASV